MKLVFLIVTNAGLQLAEVPPEGVSVLADQETWEYAGEKYKLGERRKFSRSREDWAIVGVYDRDSMAHLNAMVSHVREREDCAAASFALADDGPP